jgi:Cu(I)/Ag(I) efflux system membrane protein CusA/SilA
MEGTVQRVRPKVMTVATVLAGLVPLLWASGSGADVMKRVAAPMVGGLLTSAFLTLEIIPVVYTYWRHEQLLWERLGDADPARLSRLRRWARVHGAGWGLLVAALVGGFYLPVPATAWWLGVASGLGVVVIAAAGYLTVRPAAFRTVWPARAEAVAHRAA